MDLNVLELFAVIPRVPRHLELAREALNIYSNPHEVPFTAAGIVRFFQDFSWTSPFFLMVDELGIGGRGQGRLLTFLATTVDGKMRRVLFMRLSNVPHNMVQLTQDLELVVDFIDDQGMSPLLLGLVADACPTNNILRSLRLPTIYDRRHLKKCLAETYLTVESSLHEAYEEVFEAGTFRSAIQAYVSRIQQDQTVAENPKGLLLREYRLMGEIMEAKFRLNASHVSFAWANNDTLELLDGLGQPVENHVSVAR